MNFSYLKKTFSFLAVYKRHPHVHLDARAWWQIVLTAFIIANAGIAVWSYFFFRSVSVNSADMFLPRLATEESFSRKKLSNILDFYRGRDAMLEKLKKNPEVSRDPSL